MHSMIVHQSRSPDKCIRHFPGFTLIEMAVALTVLGLVAGILVAPLAARVEASQRHATEGMLNDIVDALIGFAAIHGRLPCPSVESDPASPAYGLEQGPPCATSVPGYLPWRSLGLPIHDSWGNHWRYYSDPAFSNTTITLTTLPGTNIQIRDHDNNPYTTRSNSRAVAVVYSTGPNRRADGLNAVYNPAAPLFEAGEPTPAFDDSLRWIGHPLLIARLAQAGRL